MTTLDDVRARAEVSTRAAEDREWTSHMRDVAIRSCYDAGNATLGQLATATGLSKQRIFQIVGGK